VKMHKRQASDSKRLSPHGASEKSATSFRGIDSPSPSHNPHQLKVRNRGIKDPLPTQKLNNHSQRLEYGQSETGTVKITSLIHYKFAQIALS
jgi:hypothetical protein